MLKYPYLGVYNKDDNFPYGRKVFIKWQNWELKFKKKTTGIWMPRPPSLPAC